MCVKFFKFVSRGFRNSVCASFKACNASKESSCIRIIFSIMLLTVLSLSLIACTPKQDDYNQKYMKNNEINSEKLTKDEQISAKTEKIGNVNLLCLMYHNVVANDEKENDYEVRWEKIENDFIELKQLGYTCISGKELVKIVNEQRGGKYVMITFDDGFFGVYKYVPRLLKKYDMKCVVAVVGEFIDMADKQQKKTRCSYMNSREVANLGQNERVEIAHHTYNFHHITKRRRGAKIALQEPANQYVELFTKDLKKMEKRLAELAIKPNFFCYPYGEYCLESEKSLKENDYQMTFTCTEKTNIIKSPSDLFLIGRINRAAKYKNISNLLDKTCKSW